MRPSRRPRTSARRRGAGGCSAGRASLGGVALGRIGPPGDALFRRCRIKAVHLAKRLDPDDPRPSGARRVRRWPVGRSREDGDRRRRRGRTGRRATQPSDRTGGAGAGPRLHRTSGRCARGCRARARARRRVVVASRGFTRIGRSRCSISSPSAHTTPTSDSPRCGRGFVAAGVGEPGAIPFASDEIEALVATGGLPAAEEAVAGSTTAAGRSIARRRSPARSAAAAFSRLRPAPRRPLSPPSRAPASSVPALQCRSNERAR